jgi:hypothetical protein
VRRCQLRFAAASRERRAVISYAVTEAIAVGIVLAVVIAAALLGLVVVRRRASPERLAKHTEVAGYVYAVIGVIYGVILAQVVVAAWDQYRDAVAVADAEANTVLNLARLAAAWPEPDRGRVEAALLDYARRVVDIEWPAMEIGDYDPSSQADVLHDLWQTVSAAGERKSDNIAVYEESLRQLDALNDARRSRVLLGESGLPITMRLTLLLGGVITIGFSYLFAVEDPRLHGLITASLAALVALLLILEYQLETPYQGVSTIPPTAMELVLTELEGSSGGSNASP